MISTLTSKLRSYIFPSNNFSSSNENQTQRKRKREFEESDRSDGDSDVIFVSAKRSKVERSEQQERIWFAGITQSMSDWVQNKKSNLASLYFWKKEKKKQDGPRVERNSQHHNWHQAHLGDQYLDRPPSRQTPLNQDPVFMRPNSREIRQGAVLDANKKYSRPLVGDSYTGSNGQPGHHQALRRPGIHEASTQSRMVQTDRRSESASRDPFIPKDRGEREQTKKLFNYKPKSLFTATESIRLDDKDRYRQLLQQFTSVALKDEEGKPHASIPAVEPTHRVSVPAVPSSNLSVLGNSYAKDLKPKEKSVREETPSRMKIKAKRRSQVVQQNGIAPHDEHTVIDITDPDMTVVSEMRLQPDALKSRIEASRSNEDGSHSSRSSRVSSPTFDLNSHQYNENWIKDLKSRYSQGCRERERKIKEAEIKAQVYTERRIRYEDDFEKHIRQRLKLQEREPAVYEEPPEIEVVDEEEKEEKFPVLTDQMENTISNALRVNPPDEIIADKFKLQITRKDMATLGGLNWLNDEIINFYMNMLMERGEKAGTPKVFAHNTFFYPKLTGDGYNAVRRWTRRAKVDIFALDYLVIPVHLGMHWCLCIVDFKQKLIKYFDSMGGNNNKCLNAVRQYLCDEHKDKKEKEFDLTGWKSEIVKKIPQQMNGSDCGMFACKYAEYITRGAPITFTQEHMPYFRRRMVYEILTGKLLQ